MPCQRLVTSGPTLRTQPACIRAPTPNASLAALYIAGPSLVFLVAVAPTLADATEQSGALDPVIVVGRVSPTGSSEVAPLLVLEAVELERFGALTVGELMRRLPSAIFSADAGAFDSLQLRGLAPEYTQVLIDGRRVPGVSEDRSAAVDRIPASLVERIEIVRSPTADLDSQGIAGTVNVILRSGSMAQGVELSGGTVADNRGRLRPIARTAYGTSQGSWSGYAGIALQHNPEVRSRWVQTRDPEGTLTEQRRGTELRDAQMISADATGGYLHPSGATGNLDLRLLRIARDTSLREQGANLNPDSSSGFRFAEDEGEEQRVAGIALRSTLPIAEIVGCAGTADFTDFKAARTAHAQQDSVLLESDVLHIRDREARADARCVISAFGDTSWRFGLSLSQRRRSADDRRSEFDDGMAVDTSPYGGAYLFKDSRADVYVQALWQLDGSLALDAGLRLEATQRDVSLPMSTSEADGVDVEWLPNMHLRWALTADQELRWSVAATRRRPPYEQLVPFRRRDGADIVTGNPGLDDELAYGVDLGWALGKANGEWGLGINLFGREISRLIEQATVATDTRQAENVGRGHVWGAEIETRYKLDVAGLPGASLSATLGLFDSRVRDQTTGEHRRFQLQPAYVYSVAYDQTWGASGLGWGLTFGKQGATQEVSGSSTEHVRTGSTLDAYVTMPSLVGLELRLVGRNLLDVRTAERIREFDGSRADGILDTVTYERESLGPSVILTVSQSLP
jgi:outer membrane receptor protein involved in Fe transport